jgi:hypothetical protein
MTSMPLELVSLDRRVRSSDRYAKLERQDGSREARCDQTLVVHG